LLVRGVSAGRAAGGSTAAERRLALDVLVERFRTAMVTPASH
jgi:hypothetical protein